MIGLGCPTKMWKRHFPNFANHFPILIFKNRKNLLQIIFQLVLLLITYTDNQATEQAVKLFVKIFTILNKLKVRHLSYKY